MAGIDVQHLMGHTRRALASPSRTPRTAVVVGRLLGLAFLVCFGTGLFSHFLQDPLPWMVFPTRPIWIYQLTQGIHITAGILCFPLLFAKLYAVFPELFQTPAIRSFPHFLERASITLFVAASLVEITIGLLNTFQWYALFPFPFRQTHYALSFVIIGSLAIHIALKLPVINQHWTKKSSEETAAAEDAVRAALADDELSSSGGRLAEPAAPAGLTGRVFAWVDRGAEAPGSPGINIVEQRAATQRAASERAASRSHSIVGGLTRRAGGWMLRRNPTGAPPVVAEAINAVADETFAAIDRTPPAPPKASRRSFFAVIGLSSLVLVVTTAGQSFRIFDATNIFAPRKMGVGPNDLPVNRTAKAAKVTETAIDADWTLTVSNGTTTRIYSRTALQALPQHVVELPIACVEGWSQTATWKGPRLRDLIDSVEAPTGATIRLTSLEQNSSYAVTEMGPEYARDELTLVALELNGEELDLDHGYPARMIAPGRPGVLQTKWLTSLEVI